MNHLRKTLALAPCLLLLACGKPASTGAAVASHTAAGGTHLSTSASSADRASERARREIAYAEFRRIVLGYGPMPIADAPCREHAIGNDDAAQCDEYADGCKACDELSEPGECGGEGDCGTVFGDVGAGDGMTARPHGDRGDRHVRDDDSILDAADWTIMPIMAH